MNWTEARVTASSTGVTVHRLPAWTWMDGITLGRHVFLKFPDAGLLAHELVHVRQQRAHPIWFWLSYVLLPLPFLSSLRWKWEAEAYRVNVAAGQMTAEEAARIISGPLYLWPCRYSTALRALG